MLRIQTLGGLAVQGSVEANGAAVQRRNLVLLALVAASAGGISRDKLLGYLCPEMSEERARNTLRQRIYALRHGLGADELLLGTTDLRLNPAVVSVDLWDFEAALAAGDMARATGVYGGPFLDGIFLRELPELEAWIEDRRAELARKVTRAYMALAADAAGRKDHHAAVDAWRRLVSLEPAAAAPAIGLINALAEAGDAPGALDHYRAYSAFLREQYEIEPDARVTTAADAVRSSVRAVSGNGSANGAANGAGNGGRASGNGRRVSPPHGVSGVGAPESSDAETEPAREDTPEQDAAHAAGAAATSRARGAGVFTPRVLAGVAAVLVAAAVFAWGYRDLTAAKLESQRILVMPFRNETGIDNMVSLANSATTAVVQELARASGADVIDARTALSGEARSIDTSAPLRQLAERLHSGSVLHGALISRGDSIVVETSVIDVRTGVIVQVISPIVVHRDSASRLTEPLRYQVAGAIAAMQDPIFQGSTGGNVTLPNIEAYGAFRSGILAFSRYDEAESYDYTIRALQLDTGFVQAALWAAGRAEGDSAILLRNYVRARANRLTRMDQAHLEYLDAFADRQLEPAYRATSEMLKLAPSSWSTKIIHAKMAIHTRRFGEAARVFAQVDINAPGLPKRFFWDAGDAYHYAGEYAHELENYDAGMRAHPDEPYICISGVRALAALKRVSDVEQRIKRCERLHPEGPVLGRLFGYGEVARELRVHDQVALSDSFWTEHVKLAETVAKSDTAKRWVLALSYHEAGRYREALPMLLEEAEKPGRKLQGPEMTRIAVAAAKSGDSATAKRYRDRIIQFRRGKMPPLAMLAQIAAAEGRDDEAMKMVQEFANNRLLVNQVYGVRVYERLWNRPEWKELFRSRN